MKTMHFTYDPIFVIRAWCNIIFENEYRNIVDNGSYLSEKYYALSDFNFKVAIQTYCEIKSLQTVNIEKPLCREILKFILNDCKADNITELKNSMDYYIYDRVSKQLIECQFGGHFSSLLEYLQKTFKGYCFEDKDKIMKYCMDTIEVKGAYADRKLLIENAVHSFIVDLMPDNDLSFITARRKENKK